MSHRRPCARGSAGGEGGVAIWAVGCGCLQMSKGLVLCESPLDGFEAGVEESCDHGFCSGVVGRKADIPVDLRPIAGFDGESGGEFFHRDRGVGDFVGVGKPLF